MRYVFFLKYDREVLRVFQIREHHAKIVKLGRYGGHLSIHVDGHLPAIFMELSHKWSDNMIFPIHLFD